MLAHKLRSCILFMSRLGSQAEFINWFLINLVEVIEVVLGDAALPFTLQHSFLHFSSCSLLDFVTFTVTEIDQILTGN